MINKLLIHIGYHKTGTTWLQNELFVKDSPYFVSLSKNPKRQSTLVRDFIYGSDDYLLNSFDLNEDTVLKRLKEITDTLDINNKIPVFSSERLSGNPHSSGFDAKIIADRLKHFFPNAKILIVIREQRSWILSAYFQYLSVGGNHNLHKYLTAKYDKKRPFFSPHHIAYHHLIEYYQYIFRTENVLVLPYETFNNDKALFFNKLEHFLDIKINTNNINTNVFYNKKSNHYLNYKLRNLHAMNKPNSLNNYIEKVRFFNTRKFIATKMAKMNKISDEDFKKNLKKEIDEWVGDRYNVSNQITQEITGLDLEGLGYQLI